MNLERSRGRGAGVDDIKVTSDEPVKSNSEGFADGSGSVMLVIAGIGSEMFKGLSGHESAFGVVDGFSGNPSSGRVQLAHFRKGLALGDNVNQLTHVIRGLH